MSWAGVTVAVLPVRGRPRRGGVLDGVGLRVAGRADEDLQVGRAGRLLGAVCRIHCRTRRSASVRIVPRMATRRRGERSCHVVSSLWGSPVWELAGQPSQRMIRSGWSAGRARVRSPGCPVSSSSRAEQRACIRPPPRRAAAGRWTARRPGPSGVSSKPMTGMSAARRAPRASGSLAQTSAVGGAGGASSSRATRSPSAMPSTRVPGQAGRRRSRRRASRSPSRAGGRHRRRIPSASRGIRCAGGPGAIRCRVAAAVPAAPSTSTQRVPVDARPRADRRS